MKQLDWAPALSLPLQNSIPLDSEPGETLPRLAFTFVNGLLGTEVINGSQEEHET